MGSESETNLRLADCDGEEAVLRPGQSYELSFAGSPLGDLNHSAFRLYLKGDSTLHPFWKSEPDFPMQYRLLDDALDSQNARRSQYCLNFSTAPCDYRRLAYKKIVFPPVMSYLPLYGHSRVWRMGLWVKKQDLRVAPGGVLRLLAEVRRQKDNVDRRNVMGSADESHAIDILPGSGGWTKLERVVELPEDTASVAFLLEGAGYEGKVWFEAPFFSSSNGVNLLPDFSVHSTRQGFNWLGVNLSRKEWPEFEVAVNGERIFSGETYERVHVHPGFEFPIPDGTIREGENTVSVKLISRYRDALPFAIHSVSLIRTPRSGMRVVACPQVAASGRPFSILVETAFDGAKLEISGALGEHTTVLGKAGLHAVPLIAPAPCSNAVFTVACGGDRQECLLERVVEKPAEDVLTGTGDAIYINQNIPEMEHFLAWYAGNNIGNLITFRPVYRWCGSRVLVPEVWERVRELVGGLGLFYAHMVDGRELPGSTANPTYEMLDGPGFLGRQNHERDGAHAYWGIPGRIDISGDTDAEQYYDLWTREPDSLGYGLYRSNYFLKNGRTYIYRDMELDPNLRQAAGHFVEQVARERSGATRHTGPATLFKYFFEAGYDWLGAELMYGPQEIVIAALRGASSAFGRQSMGGHLAVQWSTTPHDTPERYRRYRLALFTSYLQGLTEINTEEGLWHIEEYYQEFDRFSGACMEHKKVQQDFYRYVASHTRKGRFHAPMAFLQGRYDGWQCFGRSRVWGMGQDHFRFSKPEESWDLLKVLYPLSELQAIYLHPCENKPSGFYTGTPYGCADIVPAEARGDVLGGYTTLAFLGYHAMEEDDLGKLCKYASEGGTVILGWPHLNQSLDRRKIICDEFDFIRSPLLDSLIGPFAGGPRFAEVRTQGGHTALAASNLYTQGADVLARSDEGVPLAVRRPLGRGSVLFVNLCAWPAEDGARGIYEELIRGEAVRLGELERGRGWVRCGQDVQFAAYDCADGTRDLYLLAVDWYNDPEGARPAHLLLNGQWPVEVRGVVRISVKDGLAAWADEEESEILEMRTDEPGTLVLRLQGTGRCGFTLAAARFSAPSGGSLTEEAGGLYRLAVDFGNEGVKTVSIQYA